MDLRLNGTRVLVTGGAGGIGSEICRGFAREGATVAVHYLSSRDAALELASEIGGIAVAADLTDGDATDAMFTSVAEQLGGLDVCVANAGRYPGEDTPIWEISSERWSRTLNENLTTTFHTARAFLRHATITGTGSLVLVGSTAGQFGEAGSSDYAAAKGAINTGLLLSLKNEAARIGDGVRVNAVAPGWTITPKRQAAGVDEEHMQRATATMARKQLGTPSDVARQVLVLASDRVSSHQTGQIVTVAGGMEGRLVP
jgi:3-oxoacyl-[acyl-carrier protein] reductase